MISSGQKSNQSINLYAERNGHLKNAVTVGESAGSIPKPDTESLDSKQARKFSFTENACRICCMFFH